jgi:hypothetical protein
VVATIAAWWSSLTSAQASPAPRFVLDGLPMRAMNFFEAHSLLGMSATIAWAAALALAILLALVLGTGRRWLGRRPAMRAVNHASLAGAASASRGPALPRVVLLLVLFAWVGWDVGFERDFTPLLLRNARIFAGADVESKRLLLEDGYYQFLLELERRWPPWAASVHVLSDSDYCVKKAPYLLAPRLVRPRTPLASLRPGDYLAVYGGAAGLRLDLRSGLLGDRDTVLGIRPLFYRHGMLIAVVEGRR